MELLQSIGRGLSSLLTSLGRAGVILLLVLLLFAVGIPLSIRGWHKTRQPGPPPDNDTVVYPIANTENKARRGDVVFIHGLDGDYKETWEGGADKSFFFPKELGDDFKDIGFWSVKYAASSSEWYGGSMPIEDRAVNMLELLRLNHIGDKPVVFVTHSLGGLVTKQLINDSTALGQDKWANFAKNTKGVVFLATPHNGSNLPTYLQRIGNYAFTVRGYRESIQMQQLEANLPMLRQLGNHYKATAKKNRIDTLSFFENEKYGGLTTVVDAASADGGLGDVPISVDADHNSICKPKSKNVLVYMDVKEFINNKLIPPPVPIDTQFDEFLQNFHNAIDGGTLAVFKKKHAEKSRVNWKAEVVKIVPAEEESQGFLWIKPLSKSKDKAMALFLDEDFLKKVELGSKIEIAGTISDDTNEVGVFLNDCQVIRKLD